VNARGSKTIARAPTPRDEPSDRRRKTAAWVPYAFAARLAKGLRVVDCACGSGYGSWLLGGAGAASVIGVDADASALAHARKHFALPGLEFREGSLLSLPVHSASADLAVSLETIEHVRDASAFIEELARVLVPGGTLVLSTPLTRGPKRLHPEDPYHVREYDADELAALLSARFQIVERLGMHSREARTRKGGASREPGVAAALRAGARAAVPGALRTLSRALTPGRPPEPLAWISAERWTEAPLQLVVARLPDSPLRSVAG
jgi:2-polyprenyl-3-methyl-5-hydroxy-6-metoxy-1,4-benzoquinol methylase